MTSHPTDFDALITEVTAAAGRFGHREHVRLTWLAVRRFGVPAAIDLVSEGIQRTARNAGKPEKYHATLSRAWVELIGHHAAEDGGEEFTEFADRNPALLDKDLPTRFYRAETLAGETAKAAWVEPDLAPFPWQDGGRRQAPGEVAERP
ncbi:hypothetical protein ACFVVX_32810 [Kitasatospora sp. NPDC058170]|uniref:hypothetical protein n=1 Tax=Kitasatospora sp. NPDC058170 TaxID=3346364 RepID=UPI0036D78476